LHHHSDSGEEFHEPALPGKQVSVVPTFMANSLDIARTVLALEIMGLEALQASLGDDFAAAVGLIQKAKGRLAVTGMGKSGHVARKIAATFSSTGTPALFVHPAEASHGDLGMISRDDVILALSKSGETAELGDLLAYAARWSIPVVSITSAAQSALAKAAKIALTLPDIEEACGETFAPTTSTTMMMALGDALAVALLRARGFSASDFQGFHPGGKLGAALRKARDLMHDADALPLVALKTPMTKVVETISSGKFGCAGVVDEKGLLKGIITDGDIRRHFTRNAQNQIAEEVMTKNPHTAKPDTLAGDVLALMSKTKITALFVIENEKPVGIIHVHDCLSIGVV
jgi:arabinose-5-phosphate isomerase